MIQVTTRSLQPVGPEVCAILKEGEMEKKKSYSAVVWASRALAPEDLHKLNAIKELVSALNLNPKP